MISLTSIPEATQQDIQQLLEQYPAVTEAIIYGSHAKGTATERSDIDIAVKGEQLDRFIIADLFASFDDSDIIQPVDLQHYEDIKNPALKEHIDRIGMTIYSRP